MSRTLITAYSDPDIQRWHAGTARRAPPPPIRWTPTRQPH